MVLHLEWLGGSECFPHAGEHTRKLVRRNDIACLPVRQRFDRTKKLQHSAVDLFDFTGWSQHGDLSGNAVNDQASVELARPQLLVGSLAILDVDVRSVPLDDVSRLVSQWVGPEKKPTLAAVGTTEARFNSHRRARSQSR